MMFSSSSRLAWGLEFAGRFQCGQSVALDLDMSEGSSCVGPKPMLLVWLVPA